MVFSVTRARCACRACRARFNALPLPVSRSTTLFRRSLARALLYIRVGGVPWAWPPGAGTRFERTFAAGRSATSRSTPSSNTVSSPTRVSRRAHPTRETATLTSIKHLVSSPPATRRAQTDRQRRLANRACNHVYSHLAYSAWPYSSSAPSRSRPRPLVGCSTLCWLLGATAPPPFSSSRI